MSNIRLFVSVLLPVAVAASTPRALEAQLGEPNESGVSISTVHLLVEEPAEHQRLWRDLFGGEVATIGSHEVIRLPGVIFVLDQGRPSGGSAGAYVDHVGFLVPDLARVSGLVDEEGMPVVSRNEERGQLTIEFPDGVKIEFTDTPDLNVPISLHHIHFFVADGEGLRQWYVDAFGAHASMRRQFFSAEFPGRPEWPGPELDFLTSAAERVPNGGRSINRIGLEVRDLEGMVARLQAQGAQVETLYEANSSLGVARAVIVDPVGTRLELTEGLRGH